jgi:hypothetical protein
VLGTPGYSAPEAREGAPPDPRMDVFSAGVLLCVLVTGELPDAELSRVPSSLRAVVRKATARDPSARFARAFDLRRALPVAHASVEPSSRSRELDRLAPEEQSWLRAVALTLTGATALSLYALLTSITPRVVAESDALPFVVFGVQKLPGGGVYTRARFETFPVLSAALSWAIALAAYGVLRGHWRRAGIERETPDRSLSNARRVLMFGVFLDAIFIGRLALERGHPTELVHYVPVLGGVLELVMVYLVWSAVLEALRTKRPLTREPVLWLGLALSLIPPAISFAEILFSASGNPRSVFFVDLRNRRGPLLYQQVRRHIAMTEEIATTQHLAAVYVLYALVSIGLTIWLARTLFRNGGVFLDDVFAENPRMSAAVNHLLVVGFYLMNLGYAFLTLRSGQSALTLVQAIETLAEKLGTLMLVLGVIHFGNLYLFYRIRRRSQIRLAPPPVRPQYVRAEKNGVPVANA